MHSADFIVRADVHIAGVDPAIARTLELPRTLNFAQLHEILQAAFGWTDSHLHQFDIGGLVYGAPEFDEDGDAAYRTFEATGLSLGDLRFRHGAPLTVTYEYDFGDGWKHVILLTEAPCEAGARYPRCTAGARSGPPEDCGGPFRYAGFVEAWRDPEHAEHTETRRWAGPRFDPERFDLDAANKAIARALRRSKGGYRFRLEP
jgi:hypothetical protein